MSADTIPTSVREEDISILGTTLKVHVLDDGRRVIAQDDMMALLAQMAADHTDLDVCEGCSKPLAPGDLGHRCSDGPVLCEDCAPTWGEVLHQYVEAAGETTGDRTPEELAEDQEAARARVDAGDGDKKHVWPL